MSVRRAAFCRVMPLLSMVVSATGQAQDASATTETGPGAQVLQPVPRLYASFFTSPSEIREELAVHEILSRLYVGAEMEGLWNFEKQDGSTNSDTYLDSLVSGLRWVPFYGLTALFEGTYDLHESQGFDVDEATITLGAVPTEPWYILVGRTELPFGEFNSHFTEDPTTQVLGEIQGNQIAGGYDTDTLEISLAIRPGDSGGRSFSWVANVTFSPVQDVDVGMYWASDLSKSFEILQLIEEARAEDADLPPPQPVRGAGAFLSLQKYNYSVDVEYVAALDRFGEGLLDDAPQRPWACNFEATVRPTNLWEVGLRLEGSSGLPDSPEFQYGVETTYSFGEHFAARLDYLRGRFAAADAGDRDLVTANALMRW